MSEENMYQKYWVGFWNKLIRYWFYLTRGNDILNQFHTLIYSSIGLYWVLKLHNHWMLVLIIAVAIPIELVIGYIQVHYMGKVIDWLSVRFSTHYSLKQIDLLTEIRDALSKKSNQTVD